jgi:predicted metal-dependent peptidase
MIGAKLTAEQRLTKAVTAIISTKRYRALVGVMMMGNKSITNDPAHTTAATDGVNEKYDEVFVDDLTDAELRFIVLHECRHKLYKHLFIWQPLFKEDAATANAACDYVINLEIRNENADGFAVMPVWTQARMDRLTPEQQAQLAQEGIKVGDPMGLIDDKYAGMATKQVYDLLRKKKKEQQQQQQQQQGQGQGQGQSTPSMDSHDWEAAQKLTPEQTKQIERDIDTAIRQGALGAGKTGADVPRNMLELMQPKVDRREVLREFMTEHVTGRDYTTWARPNRRFLSSGVYMPSLLSEAVGELAFCVDTSYSVTDAELASQLGEVVALCEALKPKCVHILYWGGTVVRHEKYGEHDTPIEQMASSTNPRGGGGTVPSCVPQYLNKHGIKPQCAVVLTDGVFYGSDCGQWDTPVLWMITTDAPAPAVGKTLRLKE